MIFVWSRNIFNISQHCIVDSRCLYFCNRDILGNSTVREWIAWTNQHMQPYPLIHPLNRFLFLCHHVDRQDLLLLISFRWDTALEFWYWMVMYVAPTLPVWCALHAVGSIRWKPKAVLSMEDNSLDMILSQVSDTNLRHTLQFGIGLHHAGLNDRDRSLVEELFSNNKIQVCYVWYYVSC